MKPVILMCDTCGATVPERGASPAQKATMVACASGGALMVRRRAAALRRASLPPGACPRCGAEIQAAAPSGDAEGLRVMGGGGSGPPKLPN